MDINHEGIYFEILEEGQLVQEDWIPFTTGYEEVTKEQILEILTTYFEVDFGYDSVLWKRYIEQNGGWDYHYFTGGLASVEVAIILAKDD